MSAPQDHKKHRFHSIYRRALYSFLLVAGVLIAGTAGIHWIEGFDWVDSFYFTSMIATGQGPIPSASPVTVAGKIFTSFMAFISMGSMMAAFGFLFGPFFGRLWRLGVFKLEEEFHHLAEKK